VTAINSPGTVLFVLFRYEEVAFPDTTPILSSSSESNISLGSNPPNHRVEPSRQPIDSIRERPANGDVAPQKKDVPWWEDHDFMVSAKAQYSKELPKVLAEVEMHRKKTHGKEILDQVLQEKNELFDTEDFPIDIDELQFSEQLLLVDLANSLSTIAWNHQQNKGSILNLSQGQAEAAIRSMRARPLDYPPYLLLETIIKDRIIEKDEDFINEAKELYLKYLPSLGQARREAGIGSSAAANALLDLGLTNEAVTASLKHWSSISQEIELGKMKENALSLNFITDFEALALRYYL